VTFAFSEVRSYNLWPLMFQGIVASGETPIAVDCSHPQRHLSELVRRCDGLVIGGGGDVDPQLYGGDPDDELLSGVNSFRDDNERAALATARDHGKPLLAICRGAQLVDVALGGTLYADVARDAPSKVPHKESPVALLRSLHAVDVEPETLLAR
jgi:putative glutamine amidotransferase